MSPEILLILFVKLGFINHPYKKEKNVSKTKRLIRSAYMFVQILLFYYGLFLHASVTFTKTIKYRPEFVASFFEDVSIIGSAFAVFYLQIRKHIYFEQSFEIENSFSKADSKVVRKCKNQCKMVFVVILVLTYGSLFASAIEALLPMSAKEIELSRMIYQTNHPERRMPAHLYIPLADRPESWVYISAFLMTIYMQWLYSSVIILIASSIPVVLIHLKSQYEILSYYTQQIGRKHTNSTGEEIFYMNIKKNEIFVPTKTIPGRTKFDLKSPFKSYEEYDQFYLKQIVQFHNMLLIFQKGVSIIGCISLVHESELWIWF